MTVVEGRASLAAEIAASDVDVRGHVLANVDGLLAHPEFQNSLPGLLSDPGREGTVRARLHRIVQPNAI